MRHSVRDITHLKLENTLHILILPIEKSQSIQIFQKSIQFLTKLFAVWDNPTVLYIYYYVWGLNIIKYKFKIKPYKLPIPYALIALLKKVT